MTWIERKQGMDGGARKRSLRDSRRMGSTNADVPGDQGPREMEDAVLGVFVVGDLVLCGGQACTTKS